MSSHIKRMYSEKKIRNIQPFICENIQYETIMGSEAYGVASNSSDIDLYAFTIPPKEVVFPHLSGHIPGFGQPPAPFNTFQKHHLMSDGQEYDVAVYGIVKYFALLMDNNPNMIDSLFTREQSVTYSSKIGQMVKDARWQFLHKGSWHRFRGYAYAQMKRMRNKVVDPDSKRAESIMKHGYDVKHAYHVIRLLDEVEQILEYGDIDLMRNREQLKAIREGAWTHEYMVNYFDEKEKHLEGLYHSSSLPKKPDVEALRQLLLNCLEEFYGAVSQEELAVANDAEVTLRKIKEMVSQY